MSVDQIYYSEKYYDQDYEYRHVMLPKNIAKLVPKDKLMNEPEWRGIGVQQSQGWIHYMRHRPEDRERIVKRSMDVAKLVPLGFAFEDKWYVQGYVQEV